MLKMKNFIRNFFQVSPFVLSNTIVFIPYLLFLNLSDGTTLEKVLPFVLFYTFRMTGIFLLKSFRVKLSGFTILILSILLGGLGSIMGVLGTYFFPLYLSAAVCLGMSAAWLPAANTSVNFHEKTLGFTLMKGKKYLFALVTLLALIGLLTLPQQERTSILFIVYTLFYIAAYHTVTHYPDYEIDFHEVNRRVFSIREFVLFGLFFGLLILLRLARLLLNTHYLTISVIGFSVLFLLAAWWLTRGKKNLKLPLWLNGLTFVNGMSSNFIFLFGTFYTAIRFGSDKVGLYLYTPYLAAIIFSMFFGKNIYGLFAKIQPRIVNVLGLIVGLLLLLIPQTFILGVFIFSFFVTFTGAFLNNEYYQMQVLPEEQRILAKYSTQAKGSITHQFLLIGVLWLVTRGENLSDNLVLQITTNHLASAATLQVVSTIHVISITFLLVLLIGLLWVIQKENQKTAGAKK